MHGAIQIFDRLIITSTGTESTLAMDAYQVWLTSISMSVSYFAHTADCCSLQDDDEENFLRQLYCDAQ